MKRPEVVTDYLCDRSGCADCQQTGILHNQKAAGTQDSKGGCSRQKLSEPCYQFRTNVRLRVSSRVVFELLGKCFACAFYSEMSAPAEQLCKSTPQGCARHTVQNFMIAAWVPDTHH